VTHFFDSMNFFYSPAGTRWAALFYGRWCGIPVACAYFSQKRLE
jgi:hypothetical protein